MIEAISALSGLVGLGEKLITAKTEAEKQKLLIDFQRAIITAQGDTMSLQTQLASARGEIEQLKKELQTKQDWAEERQQYALRQVAEGVFCYVEKDAEGAPMPLRKYCPNCMERGRRSLLTLLPAKEFYQGIALVCHEQACKARFEFGDFLPAVQ